MLNYPRLRTVVPHQLIIPCNVDYQYVRIFYYMSRICWVLTWWVMFQVDTWKASLLLSENSVLVVRIIFNCLKKDTVYIQVWHFLDRYFNHIHIKGKRLS